MRRIGIPGSVPPQPRSLSSSGASPPILQRDSASHQALAARTLPFPSARPRAPERPALTLGAVPGPVEVLRAAVVEGPAKREAEEIEHPAGSYRLGFRHEARVLLFLGGPHLNLAVEQFLQLELLLNILRRFREPILRGPRILPVPTAPQARLLS